MNPTSFEHDQINLFLNHLEEKKIVAYKDLESLGIHRNVPSMLEREGKVYSPYKGIYILASETSQWTNYWTVAKRHEGATFCLYSALVIHGITTQHAHSVWVEIMRGKKIQMPSIDIEHITASPWVHNLGVKTVRLDKVPVKVTSLERTVADCFRLRRIVGMEVALEALKEVINGNLVQIENLESMAKKLKIFSVMSPYIQALS